MEYSEFAETTQRLCDLYTKGMNDTQVEFWYNSLKQFDQKTYKQAVGEYARSNKYMPTISDILAEIKRIKQRQNETVPEEELQRFPCEKCHGSGLVKYTKSEGGDFDYDYLCTCNCRNGKQMEKRTPMLKKWDEVFPHVENTMKLDYDLESINF